MKAWLAEGTACQKPALVARLPQPQGQGEEKSWEGGQLI